MINLINSKAQSNNRAVGTAWLPLRTTALANLSTRTFVEVHVPLTQGPIEWAFTSNVSFGEQINSGDTHTFGVGPNVDVFVRAITGSVDILVHEGS